MILTWGTALVGVTVMVLSEVWRQTSSGPARDAPLSQATAMALAMATAWPVASGEPGHLLGMLGPLLLATGAMLLVAGWRRRLRSTQRELMRLATSVVVAGVLVRIPGPGGDTLLESVWHAQDAPVLIAILLLLVAVLAAAAPLIWRGVRASVRSRSMAWATLSGEFERQGPVSLAGASTAVVMALALTELGPLSLVLFLVPLLVLQPAVNRQRRIRRAQRQTIFALARLPEEAGLAMTGHAARVAELAVPIARDMGVEAADLRDVEAAALLHDIGQVGLSRPVPGGATVELSARDQRQIASTGSSILGRTAELSRLASVVADVGLAHHRAVERGDVALASRIVRVASAYDDLTGRGTRLAGSSAPVEALERLLRSTPHEYDPEVVRVLVHQLERRGSLSTGQAGSLSR
ncbi:HD domain-containing phosphohydrolase [uncultured Serinicoccus sp.]|uniref:HD-GYP domain-containing protein n=1 Tax=uncultured Serinicoccus sp. TaxID=735514 RepID=UPI00261DAE22|nr:HD domain-containing phosphohydrolase [uncultured Serinicoccus sp.]